MIVSRTPLRISLGGGGTDLPFYCDEYGSSMVSATIDKYIYVTVNARAEKSIKLNYSKTEIVDEISRIQHPTIKEALKLLKVDNSIEIHSMASIPSGTGLGSSGAFLVGLLNALNYYKGNVVSKYKLAEDASHIMMDILKEPCGKQDQYISAFGNMTNIKITPKGKVTISPINISYENLKKLEKNIMLFYTGIKRDANKILSEQKKPKNKDYYDEIQYIGNQSLKCLEGGNFVKFGQWMHAHWMLKRKLAKDMSNSRIDKIYEKARSLGAIGGKIVGSGGGGFLMLYVKDPRQYNIMKEMEKRGLNYMPFRFDFEGSKIVYDGNHF